MVAANITNDSAITTESDLPFFNMQDVLRKWTPREKYIKISKFPDTLLFVIISDVFSQNQMQEFSS